MKDISNIPGWLFAFMMDMERALVPPTKDKSHYEEGRYPFIPLDTRSFMEVMVDAAKVFNALYPEPGESLDGKPIQFVDVGGGIGTKAALGGQILRYETCFPVRSFNIEVNEVYASVAKRLLPKKRIINKDALKLGGAYKEFDILYFYCPLADRKLQCQLEKIIYDGSKDGSIHIQILKQNRSRQLEPFLHYLGEGLYLKTKNVSLVEKAKAALSIQSANKEP